MEGAFALTPLRFEPGRSSRDFMAEDRHGRRGVVGFIAARTEPFCIGCARLRLTSTGEVIGCLSRGRGIFIRNFLESGQEERLAAAIARVLADKAPRPDFRSRRPMAAVGG
jgi:cyclic pyranopterin phosphate synthase